MTQNTQTILKEVRRMAQEEIIVLEQILTLTERVIQKVDTGQVEARSETILKKFLSEKRSRLSLEDQKIMRVVTMGISLKLVLISNMMAKTLSQANPRNLTLLIRNQRGHILPKKRLMLNQQSSDQNQGETQKI